jgi:hypothetical protein
MEVEVTRRKPLGRPRLGKRARSARFEIRLTTTDLERWQAAADRESLTLADLVRQAVETTIETGSTNGGR